LLFNFSRHWPTVCVIKIPYPLFFLPFILRRANMHGTC
jgi:hypothetical protein